LIGERVVELRRESQGPEHRDTLEAMHGLGYLYRYDSRLFLAEPIWREVMEARMRLFGPDDFDTQESIYTMGVLMGDLGRRKESESYHRTVIEHARTRPESRFRLRWALADLGVALIVMERYEEAEKVTLEALEMRRADLGEDHRDTYWSLSNLAHLRRAQKRFDEAESLHRAAIEGRRRVLGTEHPLTLSNIGFLAALLEGQDRHEEALALREEIHDALIRTVGSLHEFALQAQRRRGIMLHRLERFEDAEIHLRAALEGFRRQAAEVPKDTALRSVLTDLNTLMRDQGRLEEAAAFGAEALAVTRKELGEGHWGLHWHVLEQARTLRRLERFAEAEALFIEAEGLPTGGSRARQTDAEQQEELRDFIMEMIDLYDAWHSAEPQAGRGASADLWRARLLTP